MIIDKTQELNIKLVHDDHHYKARIEYGMKYIHSGGSLNLEELDRGPRFCIKGQTVYRQLLGVDQWIYDFNALTSTEILQREGRVIDLIPFDSWTQAGLPLRYPACCILAYSRYRKWAIPVTASDAETNKYWLLFCKWTLLDESTSLDNITNVDKLEAWLESRKSFLQQQFHETMKRHKIEYISDQEILEAYKITKVNQADAHAIWDN